LRGVRRVGELSFAAADSLEMECWRVAGVRGGASVVGLDDSGLLRLFAPRTTLSGSGRVCLSATWLRVGTVLGSAAVLTGVHLGAFLSSVAAGEGVILRAANTARPQRFAIRGEYAVACESLGSNNVSQAHQKT